MARSNLRSRSLETGRHKVGLHLWDRDGNFKVAVDLRATQARPKRHPVISIWIAQECRTGRHKVGLHLWDSDGNFQSGRRSPSDEARPKRCPIILIWIVRECRQMARSNLRSKSLETRQHKVGLHLWDRDGDFQRHLQRTTSQFRIEREMWGPLMTLTNRCHMPCI